MHVNHMSTASVFSRTSALLLLVVGSLLPLTAVARLYAIDQMNLATVFLYDGEFEKAIEALRQVRSSDLSYDPARYQTLEGLIELRRGNYEKAVEVLNDAIATTRVIKLDFDRDVDQERQRQLRIKELNIHYAEALYHLRRCPEVIDALDEAEEFSFSRPQLYGVRADCYWRQGFQDLAIETLNNGFRKFPDAINFMRQKFQYYVQSGLYTAASELGVELLDSPALSESDYLAFAQAFDGAGRTELAMELLEEARARFPENPDFVLLLAHIHLKNEQLLSAANLFEQAALIDPAFYSEAAEVYRRAGQYATSARLMAQIQEPADQLLQRVSLYIETGEYERIVALKKDLRRTGMMADDNVRYAVAYAHFRLQDLDESETLLAAIEDADLFRKATVVRQSIAECRQESTACEQ